MKFVVAAFCTSQRSQEAATYCYPCISLEAEEFHPLTTLN